VSKNQVGGIHSHYEQMHSEENAERKRLTSYIPLARKSDRMEKSEVGRPGFLGPVGVMRPCFAMGHQGEVLPMAQRSSTLSQPSQLAMTTHCSG
jgi:hypothetical protein